MLSISINRSNKAKVWQLSYQNDDHCSTASDLIIIHLTNSKTLIDLKLNSTSTSIFEIVEWIIIAFRRSILCHGFKGPSDDWQTRSVGSFTQVDQGSKLVLQSRGGFLRKCYARFFLLPLLRQSDKDGIFWLSILYVS